MADAVHYGYRLFHDEHPQQSSSEDIEFDGEAPVVHGQLFEESMAEDSKEAGLGWVCREEL